MTTPALRNGEPDPLRPNVWVKRAKIAVVKLQVGFLTRLEKGQ